MHQIQLLPARTCLWCTTPIQGRADKKFCNSSCKANYGRTTISTLPVASTSPIEPTATDTPVVLQVEKAEVINNWRERCEHAEKLLHESQQSFLLHQGYAGVVNWFLRFDGYTHTIIGLDSAIQVAASNIQAYQQHPSLRIAGHIAHFRFTDLVFIHERMNQVRERRLAGEQQLMGGLPWSGPNDITMIWNLDAEKRKNLLENLLAMM